MKIIAHRINTRKELDEINPEYGVEIDVRNHGNKLILHHEPFIKGEDLADYIKGYRHNTIIVNVKNEGIEYRILELFNKHKIDNYFFLDSSFPLIYALSSLGERNIALRFSEHESINTILSMRGKVKWVWVDCFTHLPISFTHFKKLKDAGFNLCLVSPELQGRPDDIDHFKLHLAKENIIFDAVCTKAKYASKWKAFPKLATEDVK